MVYWIVLHFPRFILDVLTVSHLSEREKDVQILLLRQQLRMVERKQPVPVGVKKSIRSDFSVKSGRIRRRKAR